MKLKFDVVEKFNIFAIISILLSIAGIVGVLAAPFGLNLFNLDIDFAGGTTMYFDMGKKVDSEMTKSIRAIFKESTGIDVSSVQMAGEGNEVIVKAVSIDTQKREAFTDALKAKFELTDKNVLNVENVSPAVGKDLQKSAFEAAAIAAILMLLYITIRFDFLSGLSAVVCLLHDVFIMISFYVVFQIPMNLNFIAAALIIFGYSINATIITFDRIRENQQFNKRGNVTEIVNKSVSQSLTRNLNTTLTTLFTIVLVYIMGVPSLKNFSLPIIIGIISGAYSSIFIAAPLWAKMKLAKQKAKS